MPICKMVSLTNVVIYVVFEMLLFDFSQFHPAFPTLTEIST